MNSRTVIHHHFKTPKPPPQRTPPSFHPCPCPKIPSASPRSPNTDTPSPSGPAPTLQPYGVEALSIFKSLGCPGPGTQPALLSHLGKHPKGHTGMSWGWRDGTRAGLSACPAAQVLHPLDLLVPSWHCPGTPCPSSTGHGTC